MRKTLTSNRPRIILSKRNNKLDLDTMTSSELETLINKAKREMLHRVMMAPTVLGGHFADYQLNDIGDE